MSERVANRQHVGSKVDEPMLLGSLTYPKHLRLRKRHQFMQTQQRGVKLWTDHLIVYASANKKRPIRLGITVSKKVGRAHFRNRLKRIIREAFRQSELRHKVGLDLVLIAKKETPPQSLKHMIIELNQIFDLAKAKLKRCESRTKKRKENTHRSSPHSKHVRNARSGHTQKQRRLSKQSRETAHKSQVSNMSNLSKSEQS